MTIKELYADMWYAGDGVTRATVRHRVTYEILGKFSHEHMEEYLDKGYSLTEYKNYVKSVVVLEHTVNPASKDLPF